MTVAELKEKLEEMPNDMPVINASCSQEVDVVELTTGYYTGEKEIECCVIIFC